MPTPTFDTQGNAGGASSGTTQAIAVSAVGANEIIVVVAAVLVESATAPNLSISGGGSNVGAWTSIASNFGQTTQSGTWGTILQAWWASTTGAVSAQSVTVTSDQTIKGVALGYFSVTNVHNISAPLDPNSSLPFSQWDPANLEPAISTTLPNDMAIWLFGSNVVSPTITAVPNIAAQQFMKQGYFTANNIITVAGVYDTASFASQQSNINFGSSTNESNTNLIVFALSGGYDVQDSVSTSDSIAEHGIFNASLSDSTATSDSISGQGVFFAKTPQSPIKINSTSQTTWTVPTIWPSFYSDATIGGIGGGGAGGWGGAWSFATLITGALGGGGGAYSRLSGANSFLSPGNVVSIQIGGGGAASSKTSKNGGAGGDTFVKDGGGTIRMLAKGGPGGPTGNTAGWSLPRGISGGSAAAGIGTFKVGGGGSYIFNTTLGAGGGAAGGPSLASYISAGIGRNGYRNVSTGYGNGGGAGTRRGYGGAGSGLGGNGHDGTATAGGAGGTSSDSSAGGAGGSAGSHNGTAGSDGSGGGGGLSIYGGGGGVGGAGGAGSEFGAGLGGSGGGAGGSDYSTNASAATGGLYGGGSGGRAAYYTGQSDNGSAPPGAQGVLLITFSTPAFTDTIATSDSFTVPSVLNASLSDTVVTSDSFSPNETIVAAISDGTSTGDSFVAGAFAVADQIDDEAATADEFVAAGLMPLLNDTTATNDAYSGSGIFIGDLADIVITSDALDGELSAALTDLIATADEYDGAAVMTATSADMMMTVDDYPALSSNATLLSDTVATSDTYLQPLLPLYMVSDQLVCSDAFFGVMSTPPQIIGPAIGRRVTMPSAPRTVIIPRAGRED